MRHIELEAVQEATGEYIKPSAGGYICRITSAFDNDKKEQLEVEFDIADGDFKDYYKKLSADKNYWGLKKSASYKETALPFFKNLISSVEKSNDGYKWNDDEKSLIGKFIGIVLGDEEYITNEGKIKIRQYIKIFRSIESINANDFKVPALKKLTKEDYEKAAERGITLASETAPEEEADEDLPF